ncbi:MAG: 2-oxoglutarate dehydrogenase complex dihydrolipoyllysine-residue succinyltransferase [Phycisphaerales bacterium JB039]
MAIEIRIPEVGESVTTGVIAAWLKGDGEYVERDEPVLELETDKVTMEVPAPESGILSHSAAEGDEVDVGATVGTITAGEPPKRQPQPKKSEAKKAAAESAEAPAAGGGAPPVDQPASREPAAPPAPRRESAPAGPNGALHATPLARKIAEDQGVDLSQVTPTGAAGRIREQDVLEYIKSAAASPTIERKPIAAAGKQAPDRASRRERMSPLRQRVATRLVEAQHTAAMLTTFNECDMTAVMALRKRYKEQFQEAHGVGLGFMSFFVKAVCGALRQVEKVNASIVEDEEGKPAIEYHDYCDVAIAVASPKGLVVPVIRSAERMSFAEIEATIKDYGTRAKDGKLTLDEMTGGTFTITNGGVFGSLNSTPILNPPQSAILGMHAIKNRAVEDPDNPGQIALRPMMYLALSYDHRIIDGAEAVTFLVKVKEAIEAPQRLMLEV